MTTTSPGQLLVVIPALNEAASIAEVVHRVRAAAPLASVLVIDDGSTDDTAELGRSAGAHVVSLPFNMGVGSALRTGFRYAVERGYSQVVQIDADGQHDPQWIPDLVAELDRGADLVIGSRFISRDGHYAVGATRGLAMRLVRWAVHVLLGRRIEDCTSGFRAFSTQLTRDFAKTYPREFLSDTVEALLIAGYRGRRVAEVPVRMRHRETGVASHRNMRLAYHYVRLFVVMALTMSVRGRRAARLHT